ncbi:MAG: tryptophan halogenase family protein [Sphingomonas sp.]
MIVGGGSAGWIAAARIAARHGQGPDAVQVVLIESSAIGTIGVGEGTWPTMRNTLRKAGISETSFIRDCDAAFKQGAKFVRWTNGTDADGYYHPLNPPQGATQVNLSGHWEARQRANPEAFADAVDFQAALCEAGLAPKAITTPEYGAVANYAYHLDAGKFAAMMRDHAVGTLGVDHIIDDVVGVRMADNGDIAGLDLKHAGAIDGDFFVDCTGFAALLIGGVYGAAFRDCSDVLFADHALAMQVPYPAEDSPIACHTISTAQSAGWIWDIGLWTRRGVGHVYSSSHISHDEAEAELRAYIGPQADGLAARRISIRAGHRETFWSHNCVAVGLSAGFLEPLEASALMLVETAVDYIADRLPRTRAVMDVMSAQFNLAFTHHWERIIEFLKLHYLLTKRTDTAFWRDNVEPASVPDGLRAKLELWRHHPPVAQDFAHQPEVFSWPSYQYILHGMGFANAHADQPNLYAETGTAQRLFAANSKARDQAMAHLPSHRALLGKIRVHGLQKV